MKCAEDNTEGPIIYWINSISLIQINVQNAQRTVFNLLRLIFFISVFLSIYIFILFNCLFLSNKHQISYDDDPMVKVYCGWSKLNAESEKMLPRKYVDFSSFFKSINNNKKSAEFFVLWFTKENVNLKDVALSAPKPSWCYKMMLQFMARYDNNLFSRYKIFTK